MIEQEDMCEKCNKSLHLWICLNCDIELCGDCKDEHRDTHIDPENVEIKSSLHE